MIRIAEAYSDENGKARGGEPGDQTGQEIKVREWYKRSGGWSVYIECIDPVLAQAAAYNMELIAETETFGYDQDNRWNGYREIIEGGSIDEALPGDFDCSSLCLAAYILAGLDIKPYEGYTGNMERILLETGKFKSYRDDAHLTSPRLSKQGSMYLEPGKHVMMVLDETINEADQYDEPINEADQPDEHPTQPTGGDRVYAKGSVRVRKSPIDGKSLKTLQDGQSLPLISTWHAVELDGERAYISANPKYTEVRT